MEQEFTRVPGLRLITLNQKGKFDLLCFFRVFRIICRMKVDVVQPFLTPATLFGLIPAFLCRTPVKIATERLGPGRSHQSLGYRFYLKVEGLLMHFVDWSVSNSEAGKEYLIQRGIPPDRVLVIYNGLNLNRLNAEIGYVEQIRYRLGVHTEGKVVGMAARLFPQKRHDVFLKAAVIVDKEVPETRFAIVGGGPLMSDLVNLSKELGIAPKVTFFGEQSDVGAYISAFDIASLTSETEGCSNSLLEAMGLGKAVVATDVGGNRELVRHEENGLLVPAGDAEAVAEAIIDLIRDEQKAKAIGQRAKDTVTNRFSVESMVNQYQTLYEETFRQKTGK
jgi:glycosyltransferase involved in cell wall biosynthesis